MRLSCAFVLLVVAATSPLHAASTDAAPYALARTEQLVFALGGHEVGLVTNQDFKGPAGWRFVRESTLTVKRGDAAIHIESKGSAETTSTLVPIRSHHEKRDASGVATISSRVEGKELVVEQVTGGVRNVVRHPLSAGLTYRAALDHEIRTRLQDGVSFSRKVFLEDMGAITDVKVSIRAVGENFSVDTNMLGLQSIETIDATGHTLESVVPSMGAVAYPVGAPPPAGVKAGAIDMFARSTWPAPRLPKNPAAVVYRIHTPDAATFAIPTDGRQRILSRSANIVEVEVRDGFAERGPLSASARQAMTGATPYEAIDDARIVEVAKRETRTAKTTRDKIARLSHFVHEHIDQKTLDRGYAAATETLASRRGDCTEHAVLLSALLRSIGIPTRLVDGVVVDGGRVGYHEWIEAQVDDEGIIPVDPMFDEAPASAARLKLAAGSSTPEGLLELGIAAGRILRPGVRVEVLPVSP